MDAGLFFLLPEKALKRIFFSFGVFVIFTFYQPVILAQTFNGQGGLPFPPTGTTGQTSSIANVSGVGILGGCKIIENVTIDLNHTWTGDIALFIIAPDGTWLELSSGNGIAGDNYKITVFTDNATTNIVSGTPPYNGDFKPEGRQNTNYFPAPYNNAPAPGTFTFENTFTGVNADGDWTLFLNDWVPADVGFLNSWSITFGDTGTSLMVDAGDDVTICPGANPVVLTATPNSATLYNYAWSNNTGASFTTVNPNGISTQPTTTTTYTVTVTSASGNCSGTDEVTVNVEPATFPGIVTFSASPTLLCLGQQTTLLFNTTVSGNWTFNLTATNLSGTSNLSHTINGFNGSLDLIPTSTTTYAVNSITDLSTGCTIQLPSPLEATVEVGSPPEFTVQGLPSLCVGESFDLATLVNLFNGTTVTYHDGNPPTPFNEIPSLISPTVTTTYTLLFEKDGCTLPINLMIEVTPGGPGPNFNDAEICEDETINLTNLITPVIPGFFSGTNVAGNFFTGNNTGTFSVVFTPTNICLDPSNAEITVNPNIDYTLETAALCETDPLLDLTTLADPNYPLGSWSGPGVSGNFFDPLNQSGFVTLTFTPDYECAVAKTTVVEVTPAEIPFLTSATLCENSPPISLGPLQDPAFPNGTWSGDGVSGTTFDPTGLSGGIPLTFTPDDPCTLPGVVIVNVNALETPDMDGSDVCELETTFDLTDLEDPFYTGGNWSGPAVTVNIFNASLASGEVVLTYQAPGLCTLPVDVTMSVVNSLQPNLETETWCEASGVLDLTTLEDPAYTTGIWSGDGVNGNLFNPLGETGINVITFTSSEYCIEPATTTIEVEPGGEPDLGIIELCTTGPVFDLTLLEDPAYPNGQWSGTGVSGTGFDPNNLSGEINLSYQAAGCVFEATTIVTVNQVETPVLSFDNICENSGLYNLALVQDPAFPSGTWSGSGVSNNFLDPEGQSGNIVLTFTSDEACTLPALTGMTINTAPAAINLVTECQPGNATYTVTFTIEGGDAPSYIVNGVPTGNVFTSAPITSATDFSFTINDANNCLPQLIQGNKNCLCATNAGTMGNTSQLSRICVNQNFSAVFNNNASLEEDTLLFVFHDNAGPTLGNVLAIQDNPVFAFPVGAQLNTTYYVSSVAGNALGNFIDPNDPCFSVAPGAPVQFYDITAAANGPNALCSNDTLRFDINVNAELPATLYLSYQFANKTVYDTLSAFTNPYPAVLVPSAWGAAPGTVLITVDKIKDVQCERSGLNTSLSFLLNPKRETTLQPTLCKGDQLIVNGVIYDENKPIGVEIVPSGLAGVCDSVIQVNLRYYPEARGNAKPIVCQGDQVVLYGETFDANRPTGNLVLPGLAANGCDSLLDVAIQLVQPSRAAIDTTLCAGTTATILGVTFDESHVSDTITLSRANVYGCDSLVEVRVSFRDIVESTYRQQYCEGTVVTIGGVNFDSNKTKDTITIAGQAGACDTLAFVDLQFIAAPVTNYTATLCEGESRVINGNTYNENKTSGTEVFVGATALGCDSIVNVALTILPKSRSKIEATLCPGETITVNGVVYDENKSSGLETLASGAVNGCDSLIEVSVSFYPQKVDTLKKDLLPNDSLVVDGVVFKLGNTSALVPYLPGSVNGCDSATFVVVRIVNNNYQKVDITTLAPTCPGDQNGSLTIRAIEGCLVSTLIIDGVSYGQVSLPFVLDDLKPGSYEVSLSSADGCSFNQNYTVLPATQPIPFVLSPATQNVYYGEDTPLTLNINPVPQTIQWEPANLLSCSDCLNPTVLQPSASTDFTLNMQDEKGCQQTAVFRLLVEEKDPVIVFPNVLSSQSPGNNQWVIQSGDGYTLQAVSVFDRWGSKVFSTGKIDSPVIWDGTYNGQQLVPGVYTYIIKVEYRNGKTEQLIGDITIIR
ncbi:MAG: gliding motility-associated C-terminal domain-containing protein [Saprospiraceae bacterium]|nr:gliding motility-associated C-terminal domain-containing protein [Saprospiraceae bacterium]